MTDTTPAAAAAQTPVFQVQRVYLLLVLLTTLATSLIWGVNTLFLLDAGLSFFEVFIANAAFSAGMVLFEVPTGVIADGWGRRVSFLLGTVTLAGGRTVKGFVCAQRSECRGDGDRAGFGARARSVDGDVTVVGVGETDKKIPMIASPILFRNHITAR